MSMQLPPEGRRRPTTKAQEPLFQSRPIETQDRLTAQITLRHEHFGDNPQDVQVMFSQFIDTQYEIYTRRRSTIGETWEEMDYGWVEEPGYILLHNKAGLGKMVHPTEEEKAEIKLQILEVSLNIESTECWLVKPGRFFVGEISPNLKVYIRSQHGDIPLTVNVFPT